MKKAVAFFFLFFGLASFAQQSASKDSLNLFSNLIKKDWEKPEAKNLTLTFSREFLKKHSDLTLYNETVGLTTNYIFRKGNYEYKNSTLNFEHNIMYDCGQYGADSLNPYGADSLGAALIVGLINSIFEFE